MADSLKAICERPVCLTWDSEFFAPAYCFALRDGSGIGFVNGAAASFSPSKECHVVKGKVKLHDRVAEIEADGKEFHVINRGAGIPLAEIEPTIDRVQSWLRGSDFTREQAFDYLQFWFPDEAFDYP